MEKPLDAWTAFGLFKLFLDIIDDGPSAIVTGVITSIVPGGVIFDVGGAVCDIIDLGGNYCGTANIQNIPEVQLDNIKILNMPEVTTFLKTRTFDTPAKLAAPTISKYQFKNHEQAYFIDRKFPKLRR